MYIEFHPKQNEQSLRRDPSAWAWEQGGLASPPPPPPPSPPAFPHELLKENCNEKKKSPLRGEKNWQRDLMHRFLHQPKLHIRPNQRKYVGFVEKLE
jgi:hypothetical protein